MHTLESSSNGGRRLSGARGLLWVAWAASSSSPRCRSCCSWAKLATSFRGSRAARLSTCIPAMQLSMEQVTALVDRSADIAIPGGDAAADGDTKTSSTSAGPGVDAVSRLRVMLNSGK